MPGKRSFGSVRRRSSGRWQAVYWHEGRFRSAGSFPTKIAAVTSLATIQSDLKRGSWIDPKAGKVLLRDYATEWLEQRKDLAVRTKELYEHLLANHIFPTFGSATLQTLTPSKIRAWHAVLSERHPSTAAKAYRLLSTIMRTAVNDGLIIASPCRITGAGTERAAERPLATVAEVNALVEGMPEGLRLVVLLATWCQLRRGEILGLRRSDVDVLHGVIRIEQSRTISRSGDSIVKPPKTSAGRRSLSVPPHVLAAIEGHLQRFTEPVKDALIFTTSNGSPLPVGVLHRAWCRARSQVGRPDLHLHDLRHTGLTLAAATGATTAELMRRAGHASAEAALRYQHATLDRDQILAEALEELARPAETRELRPTRLQSRE